MMKKLVKLLLISLSFVFVYTSNAQNQYTVYDDFPGIIKSYKPAYNENYPSWAKKLYHSPINYNEVLTEFKDYMKLHKNEKSAIIRYFKLWERSINQYVKEDGSISMPDLSLLKKNLRTAQLNAYQNIQSDRSNADWSFLGPKETFWLNESNSSETPKACPWQVNVYSFDVANTDHDILYCGTETGFVNKSIDQGQNWQQLGLTYPFGGGVTAVAIHPENENVVYVSAGSQIHKTTDGGLTWIPLLNETSFHADRLRIDSNAPDKIIAAATTGVFISTDGGENWERKWTSRSYDIEIKTDNSNIISALTKTSGKFSVIRSEDGGENFTADPNFPDSISESSGGLLAVSPANPDMILVIMLSSDYTPYLYKGETGYMGDESWDWELTATGQTGAFGMNNGQGYFDLVLDISPTNEDLIMVGTTTLFKSNNGGDSFTAIGGYYGSYSIHPDIQDIKMLNDGDTWIATDGGMTLTTDNFTSTANYIAFDYNLVGSDMWGFDQGWNEDIVVGGRYHNGNTAIADFYQPKALRMGGAESPTGWVLKGKSRHVAFNDLGNGWILPATAEGAPEGRFIFSKYPNMEEYGGRRSNLIHHPNYYGTLYLGEDKGFWKSTDLGVSYDLIYTFPNQVRFLQISYSNPDVFYADIVNKGLYKSIDGGVSWTLMPSLTSDYGSSSWKGKTFFAISYYNENHIYACLQNGTWSADIGKIFKSTDGGETWENLTGSLSEYTKCLVVQPTTLEEDIVYLFTNSRNGHAAKVYYRTDDMDDWEEYGSNYPAGMYVNMAMPFFRDSKLRVAGSGGVWESPLEVTEFTPIINPWVEKAVYDCFLDTVYFEDHSIINHEGVSWHWDIDPAPEYISGENIRNPQVVLGEIGAYTVSLTVNKDGETYHKSIVDMVSATSCPSLDDCDNPAEIPKGDWELLYVDSEDVPSGGLAINSFDDDPSSIWHTKWSGGSDPYPHEIQVDIGQLYRIYLFTYLPRQSGVNGRIKEYELYISEDAFEWGEPVDIGEFENSSGPQNIEFPAGIVGRYFRLVALSEMNDNAWSSAAEFTLVGCTDLTAGLCSEKDLEDLKAFPVPTNGSVNLTLPLCNHLEYQLISIDGNIVDIGIFDKGISKETYDMTKFKPGIYFFLLTDEKGIKYRIKVIKK